MPQVWPASIWSAFEGCPIPFRNTCSHESATGVFPVLTQQRRGTPFTTSPFISRLERGYSTRRVYIFSCDPVNGVIGSGATYIVRRCHYRPRLSTLTGLRTCCKLRITCNLKDVLPKASCTLQLFHIGNVCSGTPAGCFESNFSCRSSLKSFSASIAKTFITLRLKLQLA